MGSKIPIVGILLNDIALPDIVRALKTVRPEIRLDTVVTGNPGISAEEHEALRSCEILIADPNIVADKNLTHKFPNLKWMHSVWAGVDRLLRPLSGSAQFPGYVLTRNGGYYGHQMAEYVLGYIITRERHLFEIKEFQQQRLWKRIPYRDPSEVTLGIIGFGDIGREIAKVAKAFEMKVHALVRKNPSDEQKSSAVDKLSSEISEVLSASDYIVSVLPNAPSTDGLLDRDILSHCAKKKSVFINIGRGNVIKEETIIKALDSGWIREAILDVFDLEPLPESSPLWTHPGVTITPHISGWGLDGQKVVEDFVKNYDRFMKGEQLSFVVDWSKGIRHKY